MHRLKTVLSQVEPAAQSRPFSFVGSSFDATPLTLPFESKNLKLKNRIVMAPMTRSKSPLHIPGLDVVKYYRRRAEGQTGLIITEGTVVHPTGHGYPDVPNFFGEKSLAGWKQVVDEVHEAGGKIVPQLWHAGSVRQPSITDVKYPSLGPSAINHPGFPKGVIPKEMTQADIDEIIGAYVSAAKAAQKLGFDGVELHGAHGYLIDQFFWDATNKRTDKYGGATIGTRTQFAVELITAIRKAVGPDYPIILRFSQWKIGDFQSKLAKNPEELKSFLLPLSNAGIDIFHCSTRRFHQPEYPDISTLNLAGWTKKNNRKTYYYCRFCGLR